MTEQDQIELGNECEALMRHGGFNAIVSLYYQQSTAAIFSTPPEATDARDALYHNVQGVKQLLHLMHSYVQMRNGIIERNEALNNPEPSEMDDFEPI